jgi:hypothetical protein
MDKITRRFNGPPGQEDMPYLLTPGPLTTSRSVKAAMLADWGSRDVEFRRVVAEIRRGLLDLAGADDEFECVIVQGSGTFAIEAALGAFCPKEGAGRTLVVANGAYGDRAAAILARARFSIERRASNMPATRGAEMGGCGFDTRSKTTSIRFRPTTRFVCSSGCSHRARVACCTDHAPLNTAKTELPSGL